MNIGKFPKEFHGERRGGGRRWAKEKEKRGMIEEKGGEGK